VHRCLYFQQVVQLLGRQGSSRYKILHEIDHFLKTLTISFFSVDKNSIYECISVIVTKLFSELCTAMANKPKDKERDRNLEPIAIILLIEFNNPNKHIRKHADKYGFSNF